MLYFMMVYKYCNIKYKNRKLIRENKNCKIQSKRNKMRISMDK